VNDKIAQLTTAAGPVSRETVEDLLGLEALALKWSARINLVAPATLPDLWWRHICDSAQLLPLNTKADRWLDLGSGGGFPGLVIGAFLKRRGGHVTLVESNKKKAAFLANAAATLGLPVDLAVVRIEAADIAILPDIITARALAPLPSLLRLAAPWLESGSIGLFHKGRDYMQEVEESRRGWKFDLVEHPSRTESGSAILEISGLAVCATDAA